MQAEANEKSDKQCMSPVGTGTSVSTQGDKTNKQMYNKQLYFWYPKLSKGSGSLVDNKEYACMSQSCGPTVPQQAGSKDMMPKETL